MARKFIDCRELPSEAGCTLRMSGEPGELERAAVTHAVDVHGETDNAELRAMIRNGMRDEGGVDARQAGEEAAQAH